MSCLDSINTGGDLVYRQMNRTARFDGRLGAHGGWICRYLSARLQRALTLRLEVDGKLTARSEPGTESIRPLPSNWCDSTEVMALAEAEGGREYRNTHKIYDLRLSLDRPSFWSWKPVWRANYLAKGANDERLDFVVRVDPVTKRISR